MAIRRPRIRVPTSPYRYKAFAGTPPSPPPNAYDPSLDAQQGQASRGLADLLAQGVTSSARRTSDYELQRQGLQRQHDERIADYGRQWMQGAQNYVTGTHGLQQRFADQAATQTTAARQAGVDLGGAGALQQGARDFRQGLAQQPLTTQWARTAEGVQTGVTRTNDALTRGLAAAALANERSQQDQAFTESKSQRENTFFQQDINRSKWAQAAQMGYIAPTKPGNEHTGVLPGGRKIVFRTAKLGHRMVYVSPDGIVRNGPPGSAGWRYQLDPATGHVVGPVRGSKYG